MMDKLVKFQVSAKEECAHCHKESAKQYFESCKEKFVLGNQRVMGENVPDNVTVIHEKKSDQSFYSDSGSDSIIPEVDGTTFPNLPWASYDDSSTTPSSNSEYELTLENITRLQLTSWTECLWTGEGRLCVICNSPADTCVVHLGANGHFCFCMGCAALSKCSGFCPICYLPIVYIYKYDNI